MITVTHPGAALEEQLKKLGPAELERIVSCECPCGRRLSVEAVNVEGKRADSTTVRCECGLAYTIEDDGGQLWLAPAGGGR